MKRRTTRKFFAYVLTAALTLCAFSGCKTSEQTTATTEQPTPEEEDSTPTYNIGVCLSIDNEYYNYITTGFLDALYDTIGEDNVTVTTRLISQDSSGEDIIQEFLNENVNLIFANGKAALSAASIGTLETPIVGAGVIDFKNTLHILDEHWNRYTGRNITGISGSPSVSNQLSLLLETNPTMKRIGILYSPEDTDSIYQNEILEGYLDDAGIPWKEYELTSSASAAAEYVSVTEDAGSVILPGEKALSSAKEGDTTNVESLGEDGILTDILSPNSARTPKISKFWTEEENSETPESDDESLETETASSNTPESETSSSSTSESETDTDTLEEEADNSTIVETAASQCDALYIAAGSTLTDQIEMITNIANTAKVSTIGGDMTLGQYTLVTLYSDPYDMGYRAGKVAKRILVDGEDPAEIKIGLPSSDVKKLYQDSVAQLFELEFPKSFTEYDEFLSTYVVGSETTRLSIIEEGEDD